MIAIGRGLRKRGYDVVISLAEPYAPLAIDAGLTPQPVLSQERFDMLLANPSVWKPVRGARTMIGSVASEFLTLHLKIIQEHYLPGQTVLVSHPLDLASRIFREINPDTRLVDVHLAPSILRTYDDPPRMTPWWWEFSQPRWAVRLAYQLVDALVVDPAIAATVNRIRRQAKLPPVRRIIDQWWLSPDRILAMYPEWFAPATAQFSPRLLHCGFPLFDASQTQFPPPVDRPMVFTCGTAHRHSREFFGRAAKASEQLGYPALLLSSHAENLPSVLPANVRTAEYLPLNRILQHCSVMVHHGGIGTTSACLAAGIPQVIRPLAYDQFDNANRIEQFGAGRWLRRDRDLVSTLDQVLSDQKFSASAMKLKQQIADQGRAIEAAVDAIVA
jgi:rhamnosyltransferase subunit B